MSNPWMQLAEITAGPPLLVGDVTAHLSGGRAVVALLEGGELTVLGQGVAVGGRAYVQDGRLLGAAPGYGAVLIEI